MCAYMVGGNSCFPHNFILLESQFFIITSNTNMRELHNKLDILTVYLFIAHLKTLSLTQNVESNGWMIHEW